MNPEDSALPPPRIGRETFIPAFACAGISVLLMRVGFLGFLFLTPLGLCAVVYGSRSAWLGAAFAIAGNGVLALAYVIRSGLGMAYFGLDMLYFTVLAVGFTWVMAGNPVPSIPYVRTLFRFTAATVAGVLAFFAMFAYLLGVLFDAEGFANYIRSLMGGILGHQVLTEQLLSSDTTMAMLFMVVVRGGALVSAFFLLFFNRQVAFIIARFFKKDGGSLLGDLGGFHAPRKAIVVLAVSLPAILLFKSVSWGFLEILAWNTLVICAIMFFAQGSGVVLFNLVRRPMPMIMRLLGTLLLVVLMVSPGINVLAVGIVVLLGIVEQWLPMRTLKQETI